MTSTLKFEKKNTLQLVSAALSDRGKQYDLNEDAVFHQASQPDNGPGVGLFLVCDGLGGHQAGEVASRMAIDTITMQLSDLFSPSERSAAQDYAQPSFEMLRPRIQVAIDEANSEIRHYAENHTQKASNLGSTVVVALVYGSLVQFANVGDSRAYLWREGQLTQITQDHSLAAEMARQGLIDEVNVSQHPRRNVLSQALGTRESLKIDLFEREIRPDDKLLLCSDGLWKAFPDIAELARFLSVETTPADICQHLVTEANERDGSDNISVVVVHISQSDC